MASAKDQVKAVHPKATARRYKKNGGGSYVLIWSEPFERGQRLADGPTEPDAWKAAASKITAQAAA